jgi:hypothetical protein
MSLTSYAACPSHDVKLVMGDANAKVGRGTVHQPPIGKHSLHESTNEDGLSLVEKLDEEAFIEIERHRSIQDSRKLYKRLNVLSQERRTINQQKPSAGKMERTFWSNQHVQSPVELRDDEVDIDLPSREEIEGALKYLKKQQGSRREFYRGRAVEKRWT